MTAADTTNKEQFVLTGKELIIVHNTGAGARTYTVTSVADPFGRTGDIAAQSIAAGAIHVVQPGIAGWQQASGGYLFLEASHAEVKFGIVTVL